MIYRLAVILALAVLAGCSQPSAGPTESPAATVSPTASPTSATASPGTVPTGSPDELSEEDKLTIRTMLGPAMTVDCPLTRANRQQCGKIFAATVRLVDFALASMESLPQTKPYKDLAGDAALFKKTYSTMVSLGCFKPAAPKNFDLCVSLSSVASLTYLGFTTPLML